MSTSVWLPLNKNFPAVTPGTGARVVYASSLPGVRHIVVIADQRDGKYSVERLNQVSAVYDSPWRTLSSAPDLGLQEALLAAHNLIMNAYSVAVSLADAADRMAASTSTAIATSSARHNG